MNKPTDIHGTFTLKEMNEAYIKFLHWEPLTDKEKELARAKDLAVKHSAGYFNDQEK